MRFIKDIDMSSEQIANIKQVSKQAYVSLCCNNEDIYLGVLENMFGITEDRNSIDTEDLVVDDNEITDLNIFYNNYLLTPQMYPYLKYRQDYINNISDTKQNITLGIIFFPEPFTYAGVEIDYVIFTIVDDAVTADGISLKNSIFDNSNTYTLQISQNMCSTYDAESPTSSILFVNLIKYPNTVTLKMSQTNGDIYTIGIYENVISKNPYSDLPMYNSRISYIQNDSSLKPYKLYKFGIISSENPPDEENPIEYVIEYYSEDLRIDEQRFYFY